MAGPGQGGREEAVRREAAGWFARLRAPDGDADRPRFEAWIEADPAHGEAYRRLEHRWEQATFLASSDVARARRLPRRTSSGARWAAAAVAALVLLVASATLWRADAPGLAGRTGIAALRHQTRAGELRSIALPDGSRMILDTGSAVEVQYSAAARRVVLARGRARFEVVHEPSRRFEVAAGLVLVVARGTVFDVRAGSQGAVQVTLLEGSVDVVARRGAGQAEARAARRLAAGQQVRVEAGRPWSEPARAPPGQALWTSGMLSFDGTPLGDAVAEVNRYGREQILLADPGLASLRLTGAFRATATAEFARAVAAAFGLSVRRGPGGAFLLERPAGPVKKKNGG